MQAGNKVFGAAVLSPGFAERHEHPQTVTYFGSLLPSWNDMPLYSNHQDRDIEHRDQIIKFFRRLFFFFLRGPPLLGSLRACVSWGSYDRDGI